MSSIFVLFNPIQFNTIQLPVLLQYITVLLNSVIVLLYGYSFSIKFNMNVYCDN